MATIDQVTRRIADVGIIPVVRAAKFDDAARAVDAIFAGGISIMEITMTVPNAVSVHPARDEAIRRLHPYRSWHRVDRPTSR